MKTHRSTQFYCSGGECSVKCVHPTLEGGKQRRTERCGSFLGGWGCWNMWWSQNALECCWTESSFCITTPVPILPIWWGISFRDLAGKHFNILRTSQIFHLVTSTFMATRRKTFVDIGFIRMRKCKSGWGCGSICDLPFLHDWNWSSRLPVR